MTHDVDRRVNFLDFGIKGQEIHDEKAEIRKFPKVPSITRRYSGR